GERLVRHLLGCAERPLEPQARIQGKNSASCTQRIYAYHFSPGWIELDSRSVGTTETEVANLSPSGTLADYVSGAAGDGSLHVRVRCTRSSPSFYSSADLKIGYERP
ncbi:MAG TPA: hypothetical protein VGV57_02275, partial [Thermoleophilaceae bacterium]|nr:hypothetical protein [Thermoleophilaceae bacterium]